MLDPSGMTPATPRERPVTLKFGGAGLASGEGVRAAVARVSEAGCERPIVVVSAIGEVTDLLESAADDASRGRADASRVRQRHKRLLAELELEPGLLHRLSTELEALLGSLARRGDCAAPERDHVLSFGERMSARIVAASLRARGHSAAPVDAWELGLVSDSNHGSARPLERTRAVLGPALARLPGIPVVTGFVAIDSSGRLTTLGRNGSDLSAALVAEAARARELQLWKCVPGVFDADPCAVPEARVLPRLDHEQARALARHGASVLHPDALVPLARAGVPARVADLRRPELAGTRIDDGPGATGLVGLAWRRGLVHARVDVEQAGPQVEAFAALARDALDARAFDARAGRFELVLAAAPNQEPLAAAAAAGLELEAGLASLGLVAASPAQVPTREAARCLEREGVEVRAWSDDPDSAAAVVLLDERQLERAARCLHQRLLRPAAVGATAVQPS